MLSLSVVTVSCGHVTVKDKEVCADLGAYGAHCAHTYITERRDLPKSQWDQMRTGWLCLRAEDFSDTEDSLDELCRETSLCNYETKSQIEQFKARMKPLIDRALDSK